MSHSYICQTCGVEYDTIPKAMACFDAHQAGAGVFVEVEPQPGEAVELSDEVPTVTYADTVPEPLAAELLGRAARHMHDRAATYDKPEGERSMGRAVQAFNAITGHSLSESEGWLLLQVLKDVRLFTRSDYHADSAEDCIAYAALKAEAKSKGL
jgi:hypothetical protein